MGRFRALVMARGATMTAIAALAAGSAAAAPVTAAAAARLLPF